LKRVLITGSEGQLGQAFILKLLELNYQLIGFDIEPETKNNDILYFQVDITKPEQIETALKNLTDGIYILINNAGVAVFSPFEERTEAELNYVINVNLKGTILMTQSIFNKFFKVQKSGCIVNIGSIYGIVSGDMKIYGDSDRRTSEIYGATKAAIINLTKYFATYMAPYNIRVNCISPGGIFNPQNPQSKNFIEKYSFKCPIQRMANDSEIVGALIYLCSDDASYTTGQNIVIDGGLICW